MKKTVEDRQINRKLSAVTKGTHSQLDRIQSQPTNGTTLPKRQNYADTTTAYGGLPTPQSISRQIPHPSYTKSNTTGCDSEEIKRLLLARNKRHLQQADIEGGTSSTPIMKLVRSEHGLSTFNDQILNGNLANTIETTPEVVDWFEAIKRPPTPVIETVVGIIDKESYQDMFKNATEKTSSGAKFTTHSGKL
ncbi:hypothetical protein ACHAWO_003820 [Cyclotella atomus]|uniref:Uncharacterized protein n=1 Tax=Cyclotella atomus TaxID=382360 RepID=A0ABD3Q5G2_9STRA